MRRGEPRLNDGSLCARCGKPAAGLATINDERYCHDDPYPSCYMLALWDRAVGPRPFEIYLPINEQHIPEQVIQEMER